MSAIEALQALRRVPQESCGALVRRRTDGTMAGALLAERGRVCWAVSADSPRRLTDMLVAESDALTVDQVNEVVAQCRRDGTPLGETLLSRGLVSLPVLHRALLHHTCEALERLLRDDAPWAWVEHARYGYDPLLTFSPVEVLAGIQAIANPARAASASARLRGAIGPCRRGLVIERTRGGRVPLAHIGCDELDLTTLSDLAIQSDEVAALGATVGVEVAVAELGERGELACASWAERDELFVLLCDGELAFNRLLAHVAAMTTNP
ncbi:MAG: hypothetical protein ACTHU0_13355 [Kofleriaceae bacterium]